MISGIVFTPRENAAFHGLIRARAVIWTAGCD
jgi:hypothetical protein